MMQDDDPITQPLPLSWNSKVCRPTVSQETLPCVHPAQCVWIPGKHDDNTALCRAYTFEFQDSDTMSVFTSMIAPPELLGHPAGQLHI
jgi:hypothetical protein